MDGWIPNTFGVYTQHKWVQNEHCMMDRPDDELLRTKVEQSPNTRSFTS